MTSFDDLHTLWEAADPPPPPPTDLRDQAAHIDQMLRRRDLREFAAAAAVAAFFVVVGAFFPSVRWAALSIVGVSVWVVGVLAGVRRVFPEASPSAPLREAVAAQHRWLSAQVTLLRCAGLWYVLPSIASALAFDYALDGFSPVFSLLIVASGGSLVWLNWKAADDLAVSRDAFAFHLRALDSDA